jgi:hypothetical protein
MRLVALTSVCTESASAFASVLCFAHRLHFGVEWEAVGCSLSESHLILLSFSGIHTCVAVEFKLKWTGIKLDTSHHHVRALRV